MIEYNVMNSKLQNKVTGKVTQLCRKRLCSSQYSNNVTDNLAT